MKWRGVEISKLSDAELAQANIHIQKLKDDYLKISQSAKFNDKFKNQPMPKMNSALIELDQEIQNQILIRKNNHE